jgi:hypothetical protein
MHIREPPVAATVAVGELFVVEAHLMQNGGVDVVDADGIDDGIRAELVGFAVGVPPLNPPPAMKRL